MRLVAGPVMDLHSTQGTPHPPLSGSPIWSRLPAAYAIGVMLVCFAVGGAIFTAWLRGRPAVPEVAERKDAPLPPMVLRGRQTEHPAVVRVIRRTAPAFPSEESSVWVRHLASKRMPHPTPRPVRQIALPVVSATPRVRVPAPVTAAPNNAAQAEQEAARLREVEASASEIETAARAARNQVEAEADAAEMRATAAVEAAEAAFSRGEIQEAMRDQARQMADEAREQATAMREAARLAEAQELERARRMRQEAGLPEAPAGTQTLARETIQTRR